jgi:hypothetical protein
MRNLEWEVSLHIRQSQSNEISNLNFCGGNSKGYWNDHRKTLCCGLYCKQITIILSDAFTIIIINECKWCL